MLPTGVDTERFKPLPRAQARAELGLDPDGTYVLFAADPARPEKRFDRAQQVAGDARLLTLGGVPPERVPLFVNAANAVLVPSEREGFGLATLEALACDVPVLATPVGIAPEALAGVTGTLCAPFDAAIWTRALEPSLAAADPRIDGRVRAQQFSADAAALRVIDAWRHLLGQQLMPHRRDQGPIETRTSNSRPWCPDQSRFDKRRAPMKSRFTKAALSIVAVAAFAAPAVAQARHGSDDPASHVRHEHQRFEQHHRRGDDGARARAPPPP